MCYADNEKWEMSNNGKNRITKLGNNQNASREGKLQVFRNIRREHHQTSGDEKKVPQINEKTSRNETLVKISSKV